MSPSDADRAEPSASEAAKAPAPDAILPALDADQVAALRELGRRWRAGRSGARAALPVDPSPDSDGGSSGPTRFGRIVPVGPRTGPVGEVEADIPGGDALTRRVR